MHIAYVFIITEIYPYIIGFKQVQKLHNIHITLNPQSTVHIKHRYFQHCHDTVPPNFP